MPSSRLPPRFVSLGLALLIGGCTLGNAPFADQSVSNVATFSSPLSYQVYNILAGEMFVRQGNVAQAALHYVAAAQQTTDPAVAQRAVELAMSAEDTPLAGRALARWITLSPDSTEAVQYQALANLRAEKYAEAVKDLVKIRDTAEKEAGHGFAFIVSLLALEPDANKSYETLKHYVESVDSSPQAQLALASFALKVEQFEVALQASQAAKKQGTAAEKVQAARWVAKALAGLGKLPDAIQELEALGKDRQDTEFKLDYARLLILADRRMEALPIYQQLYAKFPDNLDILYTLSLLHLEQKSFTAAEPLITKLLTVPSRAADASYFMGQIHEGLQRPEQAIEVYQQAIGGQYSRQATLRVADLLVETVDVGSAREWLAAQMMAAPDNERKVLLLQLDGQLLHDQEQYAEAIESFGKALAVKADDPDVLYSRALSTEKLGDFGKAEADLRTVLKLQPDNATVLNALGYMLAINTQRYSESSELITKALAGRPDDPAIMDSMGWVLFLTGEPEEAETWLRKAYTLLPDPEIASHLIEVLAVLGNKAEAQAILDTMLSKFPEDSLLLKAKEKLVGL